MHNCSVRITAIMHSIMHKTILCTCRCIKGDDNSLKHVKSIQQNKYKIDNNSPSHLIDIGFHKSYDVEDKYIYNFIVLKYEKMVSLRGRIIVYPDTKEIKINVMDNNYALYAPFYHIEYGNYDVIMEKINNSILSEFKKLGISKMKEKTND